MTFASPPRRLAGSALALAVAISARTAGADPPPTGAAPVFPGKPLPAPSPPMTPSEVPPGYVFPPGYVAPPNYGPPPGYYGPGAPVYYPPPLAQPPPLAAPFDPYFLPPPPPRRRYDTRLFVGGVTAVVGGMTAVFVGAYFVSSAADRIDIYCDTPSFPCAHKTDMPRLAGGAVLMTLGALVGAAGIPMWIVGSQYVTVPKDEKKAALRPELRLGLGSASAGVRF